MDRYYLGQPYTDRLTVKNALGDLVDPDTVVMTFRYPNGSTVAGPAAVRDSLGHYHADVTLPAAGVYRRLWVTTGPGAGVNVQTVTIVDPMAPELASLEDVKDHLNIEDDNTTFDAELSDFLAAAVPLVEALAGPVLPVTHTERLYGDVLVVRHPPILSVTSLSWDYGGTAEVDDLDVDNEAGVITYALGLWRSVATVVYVSGRDPVPEAVNLGTRVIVEHWWRSQRGRTATDRSRRDDVETIDVPGFGFAVPRYAAQLLAPFNPDTGIR